jgi:hypothetical protein
LLHGLLCLGFSSAYFSAVLKNLRGATYCGQKRERRVKKKRTKKRKERRIKNRKVRSGVSLHSEAEAYI